MAAVDVPARDVPPIAPEDNLDDIFSYGINQDLYKEIDTNMDKVPQGYTKPLLKPQEQDFLSKGLGLDEEIKVTKKRAPVAKLDELRLLSQAGIPKLQRFAKTKLKFKGKGHEYSDLAKLLGNYQLWLDDLYPRAKFADGLQIIEKLGHSKSMRNKRKEWISKAKVQEDGRKESDEGTAAKSPRPSSNTVAFPPIVTASSGFTAEGQSPQQSEDDALFLTTERPDTNENIPDEDDDLDALLAENNYNAQSNAPSQNLNTSTAQTRLPGPDDEEEAMAAMHDIW